MDETSTQTQTQIQTQAQADTDAGIDTNTNTNTDTDAGIDTDSNTPPLCGDSCSQHVHHQGQIHVQHEGALQTCKCSHMRTKRWLSTAQAIVATAVGRS